MLVNSVRAMAFVLHCWSARAPDWRALKERASARRLAAREDIDRLRLGEERSAMVLSLWSFKPARQCAVAARYEGFMTAEAALLARPSPRAAVNAPSASARALQQRLAVHYPSAAAERPTIVDVDAAAARRAA